MTTHALAGRPAVFLDRDGVLNHVTVRNGTPRPPPARAHLRVIDGVAGACARLRGLGFALVVVTNQPDIARGRQSRAEVERMHDLLRRHLPLDEVVVCPHDDGDGCDCRKPKPGMILDAARRLRLDLSRSVGVGDRWRDVEAARNAGIAAVHIDRGYGERRPENASAVAASLVEAVPYIESLLGPGKHDP